MELKEGYKQTEVGVIPEDWDVVLIEKIAEIKTGDKNTQDKNPSGRYPFFVRSQNVERIDSYSFDCEAILTAGDGVGTGKVFHYINGKFDVHQRVYIINNFSDKVLGYYFFLYFSSHFYNRIMQMTAKSSVDSVRRDMIAEMPIGLPPQISEQLAISTALSDVDALLSSLDALIAKKRDIKTAAMQELLTGKKRLPGFSGEWVEKRLDAIGAFIKGRGISRSEAHSGPIPCIRYGEIYTHHTDIIRNFYSFISREVAQNAARLQSGDILFTCSGETKEDIGKSVAFTGSGEAYAGGDIIILRNTQECPEFLGYRLNACDVSLQKSSAGQGDAVVHISATSLGAISVTLPQNTTEQAAIAAVLSDMDAEIAALEARRAKVQSLKQGMMQELLTGRTRLLPEGERHG